MIVDDKVLGFTVRSQFSDFSQTPKNFQKYGGEQLDPN